MYICIDIPWSFVLSLSLVTSTLSGFCQKRATLLEYGRIGRLSYDPRLYTILILVSFTLCSLSIFRLSVFQALQFSFPLIFTASLMVCMLCAKIGRQIAANSNQADYSFFRPFLVEQLKFELGHRKPRR